MDDFCVTASNVGTKDVEPRLVALFAGLLSGQLRRPSGDQAWNLEMQLTVAAAGLLTYNKVSGSGEARERMNWPWNFIRKMSWPHHCCKG